MKPVYSDRPGEWWRSGAEAAVCLSVSPPVVCASAKSNGAHTCRGRSLSLLPPPWAIDGELPPPQEPGNAPEVFERHLVRRQVWSDRPGEWWPSVQVAADSLNCPRSTLVAALNAGKRFAGRTLYEEPPPWAVAKREADIRGAKDREPRRIAAIKVRVPRSGRVHMGNGYGPDGKWYGTGGDSEQGLSNPLAFVRGEPSALGSL